MDTVSIFGWIAASLVLSSFYFRNMTSLRLAAIASNVLFIIYAILANAWPILVLHCLLFPLNLWRLLELHNLRRTLMGSSLVQVQVQVPAVRLLPFMQKSKSAQGGVIFEKGDAADHVYYLLRGEILLQDSKKLVTDGQLLGLTGVFSNERRRTDSALCLTDVEFGVIPALKFRELVCQDPMLGNFVIGAVVQRQLTLCQKSEPIQIEDSLAQVFERRQAGSHAALH